MTADYVGSGNNVPLLEGDGNFGSAFINDAAATRYIFARMNPILKSLYIKDDFVNLEHQDFEGAKIEPRYYCENIISSLARRSHNEILASCSSCRIMWIKLLLPRHEGFFQPSTSCTVRANIVLVVEQ